MFGIVKKVWSTKNRFGPAEVYKVPVQMTTRSQVLLLNSESSILALTFLKCCMAFFSPLFQFFFKESNWENLGSKLGKKDTILHWEWDQISAPNQADREPCQPWKPKETQIRRSFPWLLKPEWPMRSLLPPPNSATGGINEARQGNLTQDLLFSLQGQCSDHRYLALVLTCARGMSL